MRIQLLKVPNQVVPFLYGNITYVLTTRLFNGLLYASLSVDKDNVVLSERVVVGNNLLNRDHLERKYGSLIFRSKFGATVEDYTAYNDAIYLEFTPPVEET